MGTLRTAAGAIGGISVGAGWSGRGLARRDGVEYDELADVYDLWLSGDASAEPCGRFYGEALRGIDGPVLELGVGTGRIAAALRQAGVHVVGLDRSLPMLAQARRRAADLPLTSGVFQALPFRSVFAAVICPMRTIGHLLGDEDRDAVFSEVFRVLRPGGAFIYDHYDIDLDWARAHDGVPILMHAGRDAIDEGLAVLIWDRYDYDFDGQRLHCTVRVERVGPGGSVRSTRTTEFDFCWQTHAQFEALAVRHGFLIEATYGDFDGSPYGDAAEDLVWVLRKPPPC